MEGIEADLEAVSLAAEELLAWNWLIVIHTISGRGVFTDSIRLGSFFCSVLSKILRLIRFTIKNETAKRKVPSIAKPARGRIRGKFVNRRSSVQSGSPAPL
jgi:hypothetical protein